MLSYVVGGRGNKGYMETKRRLYLLEPIVQDGQFPDGRTVWCEKYFRFIVRAKSPREARMRAQVHSWDGLKRRSIGPWMDANKTCCSILHGWGRDCVVAAEWSKDNSAPPHDGGSSPPATESNPAEQSRR